MLDLNQIRGKLLLSRKNYITSEGAVSYNVLYLFVTKWGFMRIIILSIYSVHFLSVNVPYKNKCVCPQILIAVKSKKN